MGCMQSGDWWGAEVDIPPEAVVVDWVLSDSAKRLWDNNSNSDYQSVIRDGLNHEQLVEVHFLCGLVSGGLTL